VHPEDAQIYRPLLYVLKRGLYIIGLFSEHIGEAYIFVHPQDAQDLKYIGLFSEHVGLFPQYTGLSSESKEHVCHDSFVYAT